MSKVKLAIVHDDFMQWGGAERLVKAVADMYPDASIFTAMVDSQVVSKSGIDPKRFVVSALDKLPLKRGFNKGLFSLYPTVFEQFDFSDFETVFSSSARFAHGVITRPFTRQIAYINSPFRGFWDPKMYFGSSVTGRFMRTLLTPELSRLRQCDFIAGQRPDVLIANSKTVRDRIRKYWRRDSSVIYPFVDLDRFSHEETPDLVLPGKYFVVISRLVEWKRIDIAIKACENVNVPLFIIGTGKNQSELAKISGNETHLLGYLPDPQTTYILKRAQALIHPQLEDFGMTVIEANAVGTPVVAYGAGGATETILQGQTGELFKEQSVESLVSVLANFDRGRYNQETIIGHARSFSRTRFEYEIQNVIENLG